MSAPVGVPSSHYLLHLLNLSLEIFDPSGVYSSVFDPLGTAVAVTFLQMI